MRTARLRAKSGELLRAVPIVVYPAAAAVAITMLDGGGFEPSSQSVLIVFAALALLVATYTDGEAMLAAARSPIVLVLGLLGTLSLFSVIWTVGDGRDAARWGLVIIAFAVLASSGGVIARRVGAWPIAIAIAILAAIEAVLGLGAAALHALPDAEWIGGSWRPGGSLQYPPALGLLELAALPALLSGLSKGRLVALAAAAGTVVAGATLGCAESRLDVALAAVVLVAATLRRGEGEARRAELAAGAALVVLAALAGHLVLGRHVPAAQHGGGAGRLIVIAVACGLLTSLWLPMRSVLRTRAKVVSRGALVAGAVCLLAIVGAAATVAIAQGSPRITTGSDVTHGRIHEWEAAVDTWLQRPLLGAGADSYSVASARHQGSSPTLFAHDLPLELAAELGVPGLLLGVALYFVTILALVRARSRPELWLLGPLVAAFMVANLVDWPWHLAGLGGAWAVAAGGLVAASAPVRSPPCKS